jgi:hypothetical protein
MRPRLSAGPRRRFPAAAAGYASVELAAPAVAAAADLASYLELRVQQSMALCPLTEYAAGVSLSAAARRGLAGLHQACAEHVVLANDLFSARREHFAGDHANAVCLLTTAGRTLQQAADQIVTQIQDTDAQAAAGLARVTGAAVPAGIRRYVQQLGRAVAGNLLHARSAPRYHGTGEFTARPIGAGEIALWPGRTHHWPA